MRTLMIAPPGAGKGTQGALIAQHFGVRHIATGDLLRDHVNRGSDLGRQVQDYLARGALVPDDVVLEMVRAEMTGLTGDRGYVLDGIPRTIEQARAVYEMAVELELTADVALHLRVDDAELVRRLLARASEQGRVDDTEDVIRHRLELYYEVTHPILEWYGERGILVTVDGARPQGQVTDQVLTALEVLKQTLRADPSVSRHPIDLTALGAAFHAQPLGRTPG